MKTRTMPQIGSLIIIKSESDGSIYVLDERDGEVLSSESAVDTLIDAVTDLAAQIVSDDD